MKKLRWLLMLALTLALVCALSLTARADMFGGDCGAAGSSVTWSLDMSTGVLTISGSGAMADFEYEKTPWQSAMQQITTVVIGEGVTRVGWEAFDGAGSLTAVTLPAGLLELGDCAFYNCVSLGEIELPAGLKTIGYEAFSSCPLLRIDVPDSVSEIGDYAFEYSKLTEITIPDSVTGIGCKILYQTPYLEDSSHWDADGLCYVGHHLVAGREGLTGNVTVREGTRSIAGYVFWADSDQPGISTLALPASLRYFHPYAVTGRDVTAVTAAADSAYFTTVDGILYSKDRTELIHYPAGKTDTAFTVPDFVTAIGDYAFYNCAALTDITIPVGVTAIGGSAFCGCDALRDVTLPYGLTSLGGSAFEFCDALRTVSLPNTVTSIGDNAFSCCPVLTELVIPDSVTQLGSYIFQNCYRLQRVTVGSGVTVIPAGFCIHCYDLNTVVINSAVTGVGECAFDGCCNLRDFTLPDSVAYIGDHAFQLCCSIRSLSFGKDLRCIGEHAFVETYAMEKYTVAPENTYCASDACGVLYRLNSEGEMTELINYPASRPCPYYSIPDTVTTLDDYSFYQSSRLLGLYVPNSVTEIPSGDFRPFINCIGMTLYAESTSAAAVWASEPENYCTFRSTDGYTPTAFTLCSARETPAAEVGETDLSWLYAVESGTNSSGEPVTLFVSCSLDYDFSAAGGIPRIVTVTAQRDGLPDASLEVLVYAQGRAPLCFGSTEFPGNAPVSAAAYAENGKMLGLLPAICFGGEYFAFADAETCAAMDHAKLFCVSAAFAPLAEAVRFDRP